MVAVISECDTAGHLHLTSLVLFIDKNAGHMYASWEAAAAGAYGRIISITSGEG